jgi:hypothetical protein
MWKSSGFCGVFILKPLINLADKYCEQTKFNNALKWNNDLCMPLQPVLEKSEWNLSLQPLLQLIYRKQETFHPLYVMSHVCVLNSDQ